MSRLAKLNRKNLLSKLPPKPNQASYYYLLHEETESPIKKEAETCGTTTATGSREEQSGLDLLSLQQGAIKRVGKLYKALAKDQSGILNEEEPRVWSQPELSKSKDPEFKSFKTFSDQNKLKHITATKNIKLSKSTTFKRFRALLGPTARRMSPEKILKRLFSSCQIWGEVIVLTIVFLERALGLEQSFKREHFQKLLTGCLLLAHKYLVEDLYWQFDDLSYVSGVRSEDLERIEGCVFGEVLGWRLFVTSEEFRSAKSGLISELFLGDF